MNKTIFYFENWAEATGFVADWRRGSDVSEYLKEDIYDSALPEKGIKTLLEAGYIVFLEHWNGTMTAVKPQALYLVDLDFDMNLNHELVTQFEGK